MTPTRAIDIRSPPPARACRGSGRRSVSGAANGPQKAGREGVSPRVRPRAWRRSREARRPTRRPARPPERATTRPSRARPRARAAGSPKSGLPRATPRVSRRPTAMKTAARPNALNAPRSATRSPVMRRPAIAGRTRRRNTEVSAAERTAANPTAAVVARRPGTIPAASPTGRGTNRSSRSPMTSQRNRRRIRNARRRPLDRPHSQRRGLELCGERRLERSDGEDSSRDDPAHFRRRRDRASHGEEVASDVRSRSEEDVAPQRDDVLLHPARHADVPADRDQRSLELAGD